MLDFVSADEEDARTIHWVYSIEGDVGKSWLKDYMVKTYEALVVAVDKPTDVKHLILTAMKGKNNKKFKKNPIVIADLSRTESRFLDRPALYTTLETICGNFHSTKYEGGTVQWERPPHVIVFANQAPAVEMLSPDRFQVYLISKGSLDLMKDTTIDAQLEAYRQELARLQAEKEEAILNGPQPTPSDTEAAFFQCYQRATNAPAILSSKMHWTLKRAGYRLTQKAMNTWIREHFHEDDEVAEIRPKNKHCWKGFKPV